MNKILRYAGDFISLFFPRVCCGCGHSLLDSEEIVCTDCLYLLPYTNFHLYPDNPVAKQFWGRIPLVFAGACFYFSKRSKVQRIIHQLKYNNKPEVGTWLGQIYGKQIVSTPLASTVDVIIPVPLHRDRQRKRGYNQSEYIARGISEVLGIPVDNKSLIRTSFTISQTGKSRFARYENMQKVFMVVNADALRWKHILVVDDVITTGATIEACCSALFDVEGIRLSAVAAAYAN